jgi:pimeloyl-ACP methyl ester carboxylesterase
MRQRWRVPGLSANLCGFDRLAERLAGDTRQLVAIDLRGRGRSEVTGAGTYGWRNHARDVLGIAGAVGHRRLRSSASPAVRPSP